ncbi:MAG: recombination protein O N-terminal domain-containing protein [Alphaproteobacteria bacterium]|nr:recombination protein O N-terminal domain-containing protein [Alphaproteobacteria bacterium]
MNLESTGILIGLRPIGERDCVAMIFTRDFGMMHGVLRAAQLPRKINH